jgi:predicted  nucleic acid-binding Zn-ribbon protein
MEVMRLRGNLEAVSCLRTGVSSTSVKVGPMAATAPMRARVTEGCECGMDIFGPVRHGRCMEAAAEEAPKEAVADADSDVAAADDNAADFN